MKKRSVLFVCLGNICRSPMAEAIFIHLLKGKRLQPYFACDSAGISDYHVGQLPDARVLELLAHKGVETKHQARQFVVADVDRFDHIFAMDSSNHRDICRISGHTPAGLALMRSYDALDKNADVPDPYFGGLQGFEAVYDMLERSLLSFIAAHS